MRKKMNFMGKKPQLPMLIATLHIFEAQNPGFYKNFIDLKGRKPISNSLVEHRLTELCRHSGSVPTSRH